jgi:hypothetical protein
MRTHTRFIARTAVLVLAGCFAACNGTIDKEPNVVLEVSQMSVPPVTSSQNGTNGTCTYTVTNASASFNNKPKNALAATSPFNDIVLQNVAITYVWDDGAVTSPATAGLAATVPAGGSVTAQWSIISNASLGVTQAPDPVGNGRAGHTANLGMTFTGRTVSGDSVSAVAGGTLQVNSCTVNVGACCGTPSGCQTISQAACANYPGAAYKGDNTNCSTQNICL